MIRKQNVIDKYERKILKNKTLEDNEKSSPNKE
jgi:hypothetical protein